MQNFIVFKLRIILATEPAISNQSNVQPNGTYMLKYNYFRI